MMSAISAVESFGVSQHLADSTTVRLHEPKVEKSKEEGSESEESGSSKAASASVEGGGRPQAAASSAVAEQGEAPEAPPYAEYSVDEAAATDVDLDAETVAVDNDITFTEEEISWLLAQRGQYITPGGVRGKDDSEDCEGSEEWAEDHTMEFHFDQKPPFFRTPVIGKMNVKETSAEKRQRYTATLPYTNTYAVDTQWLRRFRHAYGIRLRRRSHPERYMRKLRERIRTAQRAAQPVPRGVTGVTRKRASRS